MPRDEIREGFFWRVEQTRESRYGPEPDQALDEIARWFKADNGVERSGESRQESVDLDVFDQYLVNLMACCLAAYEGSHS